MENYTYKRTTWVDNSEPALNADNLNHIEEGIANNNQATHDLKEFIVDKDSKVRELLSETARGLNDKIDTVDRAVALKTNAKGKTITLEDSANHSLYGLKVFGNSSITEKGVTLTLQGLNGETQSLNVPYKLKAVPVTANGDYMDENIQDWLSDYVDFEKGVLVRKVAEDGTVLDKPITSPLNETELQAYRRLMTLYPYTTITNDKGAYMDVKYVADTKNYIDNKFEELRNAIIATGGNV